MNEFLTILTTKTAILTAFALLVGAATTFVRRLDAKTTQLCWALVLASGIVGGIAPFGPTVPGISWPTRPETPATAPEIVVETKIEPTPLQPEPQPTPKTPSEPEPTPTTETIFDAELETPTTETVFETELETPPTSIVFATEFEPPTPESPSWTESFESPPTSETQLERSQHFSEPPFETPEAEPEPQTEPTPELAAAPTPLASAPESRHNPSDSDVYDAEPFDVSRLLFAIYWSGVLAALVLGTVAAIRLRLALKTAVPADAESTELLRREAFALGVSRRRVERLRLLTTKRIGPALVVDGFCSAAVVVPENFWAEASQVVKLGVLRHELAHWKRRDVVFSTAARAVRAFHWFNPAAFWAVRRFDEAVENRCDETAFGGGDVGAARFVEAILATAESREIYSVLQKKFGGSAFLRRAGNLQRLDERKSPMLKRTITLCVVAAFCVATLHWKIGEKAINGQTPAPVSSDAPKIASPNAAPQTPPNENGVIVSKFDFPLELRAQKPKLVDDPQAPTPIAPQLKELVENRLADFVEKIVNLNFVVVDTNDNPVEGARVWAVSRFGDALYDAASPNAAPEVVVTDADGRAQIKGPVEQRICVYAVSADGTRIGRADWRFEPYDFEDDYYPPDENGEYAAGGKICLRPGTVFTGTVVDAVGTPVEGATVRTIQNAIQTRRDAPEPLRYYGLDSVRLFAEPNGWENLTYWANEVFHSFVATTDANGEFRFVLPNDHSFKMFDHAANLSRNDAFFPYFDAGSEFWIERRFCAYKDGVGLGLAQRVVSTTDAGTDADFAAPVRLTLGGGAVAPLSVRVADKRGNPVRYSEVSLDFDLKTTLPDARPDERYPFGRPLLFDGASFEAFRRTSDVDGKATFPSVPRRAATDGRISVRSGFSFDAETNDVRKIDVQTYSLGEALQRGGSASVWLEAPFAPRIVGTVKNADGSPAKGAGVWLTRLAASEPTENANETPENSTAATTKRQTERLQGSATLSVFADENGEYAYTLGSDEFSLITGVGAELWRDNWVSFAFDPPTLDAETNEARIDFVLQKGIRLSGKASRPDDWTREKERKFGFGNYPVRVAALRDPDSADSPLFRCPNLIAPVGEYATIVPAVPGVYLLQVGDVGEPERLEVRGDETEIKFDLLDAKTEAQLAAEAAERERVKRAAEETAQKSGKTTIFNGIVVGANGAPLPGARVWVVDDSGRALSDAGPQTVLSDASGRFELSIPTGGTLRFYAISADETEIGVYRSNIPAPNYSSQSPSGKIATAIETRPGVVLSGTVVDASGTPVEGATVRAIQDPFGYVGSKSPEFLASLVATSDENGAFRFVFFRTSGLQIPFFERRFCATKDGVGLGLAQRIASAADADAPNSDFNAPIRLTLAAAAPLSVRFVDKRNEPFKKTNVALAFDLGTPPPQTPDDAPDQTFRWKSYPVEQPTTADGTPLFDGVGFEALDRPTTDRGAATFAFVPKTTTERDRLRLLSAAGRARTGDDFRVKIRWLDDAKPISLQDALLLQGAQKDDASVLIVAPTLKTISGTLRTADGSPAKNARVVLTIYSGAGPNGLRAEKVGVQTGTGPDGRFSLRYPADAETIGLGFTPDLSTDPEVGPFVGVRFAAPDATETRLDFSTLATETKVSGQFLTDDADAPRAARTLEISAISSRDPEKTPLSTRKIVVDEEGRFETVVPATATLRPGDAPPTPNAAENGAAKTAPSLGSVLSGTVVDAAGNPVEGATILAIQQGGLDPSVAASVRPNWREAFASLVATSDKNGAFRFVFPDATTPPANLAGSSLAVERRFCAYKDGVGLALPPSRVARKSKNAAAFDVSDFAAPLRLTLEDAAPLPIRLLDDWANPIQDAKVSLDLKARGSATFGAATVPFEPFVLRTDANGIATFPFVPRTGSANARLDVSGGFSLDGETRRNVERKTFVIEKNPAGSRFAFRSADAVADAADAGRLTFRSRVLPRIFGTVRNADGSPATDANVRATVPATFGTSAAFEALENVDANGEFNATLDFDALDRTLAVGAVSPTGAAPFLYDVRLDPQKREARLDFKLEKGIKIVGKPSGPVSRGLYGVRFAAFQRPNDPDSPFYPFAVSTDLEGRFEAVVPPTPGEYAVWGFGVSKEKPRKFVVRGDETQIELELATFEDAEKTRRENEEKERTTFSGTVVDANGRPSPGARVWAVSEDAKAPFGLAPETISADASGRFELNLPSNPTRGYRVFAVSADETQIGVAGGIFSPERDATKRRSLTVATRPGTVLSGTVVDAAGNPVEGATVRAIQNRLTKTGTRPPERSDVSFDPKRPESVASLVATSDEKGEFRLVFYSNEKGTKPDGGESWLERRFCAFKDGVGLGLARLVADAAAPDSDFNAPIRLTLEEAAPLSVRVVDDWGNPVQNAEISFEFDLGAPLKFDATPFEALGAKTDADGNATLPLVPQTPTENARLNVRAGFSFDANGEKRAVEPSTISLQDAKNRRDGDAPVRFETPVVPRLVVSVKNADGSPATDARVSATYSGVAAPDASISERIRAAYCESFPVDENGVLDLSLRGYLKNVVGVAAGSPSGASAALCDWNFDTKTKTARIDLPLSKGIQLTLQTRPGAAPDGTALGRNVKIVALQDADSPNAKFSATALSTDASGRLETRLPSTPGDYWIFVPGKPFNETDVERKLTVRGDETQIELDLSAPSEPAPAAEPETLDESRLSGTVVDSAGNPASGARVWAVASNGGSHNVASPNAAPEVADADANGRFSLPAPPYTEFFVFAVSADETQVGVERGFANRCDEIKLRPGTVLSGTVVDAAGNPVEGATIRAFQNGGQTFPSSPEPIRRYFGAPDDAVFASLVATSDENGAFRLVFPPAVAPNASGKKYSPSWFERRICAFKDGVGIALAQREVDRNGGIAPDGLFNAPFRLTLEEYAALPIRIADQNGTPAWLATVSALFEPLSAGEAPGSHKPNPSSRPTLTFDGSPFETLSQRSNEAGEATLIVPRGASENAKLNVRFDPTHQNVGAREIEPETLSLRDALKRFDADGAPVRIDARFSRRVVGTVKNADGSPAFDAVVWLTVNPKNAAPDASIWSRIDAAKTISVRVGEKDGRFSQKIELGEDETLSVAVQSPDGAAAPIYDLKIDPKTNEARADFVLSKEVFVSGKFYPDSYQERRRIQTAKIAAFEDPKSPATSPLAVVDARANAHYRFEAFLPAAPGEYWLACENGAGPRKLEIRGDETHIKFDLVAPGAQVAAEKPQTPQKPNVLSGTVVDGNGNPSSGARVWAVSKRGRSFDDAAPKAVVADANGVFELEAPTDRARLVYAVSADETQVGVALVSPSLGDANPTIRTLAGTVLSGTVVDAAENPVEGATIRAFQNVVQALPNETPVRPNNWSVDDFASLVATSDANGAFRLVFPPTDADISKPLGVQRTADGQWFEHRICASKDGVGIALAQRIASQRDGLAPESDFNAPIRLTLDAGATLPVRVVDKLGAPIRDSFVSTEFGTQPPANANAADGATEIPAVPFDASPFETLARSTNRAGEATLFVPRTASEDARLTVAGGASEGDEFGLRGVEPRTFALRDALSRVDDGGEPLRVEAPFLPRIVGTVKNADGSPAKDAVVLLRQVNKIAPQDATIWRRVYSESSRTIYPNLNGVFGQRLNDDERWTYNLGVRSPSGVASPVFDLKFDPETNDARVDFVLQKGIKVTGKAYPNDYKGPFAPRVVKIGAFEDPQFPSTSTLFAFETKSDGSGRFEAFLPAVPGEYWVACQTASEARKIEVRGDETEIEVEIFPTPTDSGAAK